MHEETRRRLLRAAFVLLCLVPTAGVLAWTLVRSLPFQTRRLEQRLQEQLGVGVQIGRLSHPRPRQLRLEQVTLQDPESQQPLAQLPLIDAYATAGGWRLAIPQLSLPQEALPSLWQIVHQRLLRSEALAQRVAHVSVQRVLLEHPRQALTLHDANWTRARDPNEQRSQLYFALADSKPSQGVRVDLERDRSGASPVTRLQVDTGDSSLPLSLVATVLGCDGPASARFRGTVPVVWQRGRWRAEFVGQVTGLNLSDLSRDWIPYDVQGSATLNVKQCAFNERGLQSMQGWLGVDELAAPWPLIDSLIRLSLFSPGPALARLNRQDAFRAAQLGVSFAVGERGLKCWGAPDEAGLKVAAAIDAGPVLLSEAFVRMDYLICALVPEQVENVYEARARLMNSLPATLPQLVRPTRR